ncbi:MAG: thiamine biosynthesis protein ThiJ [Okeania sp. SIO2F4]|uniref:DJ-1/PfpI family protein n=1 Tax=Okeania sp. SIO2F4 TaxID=2607790 RepID=UPI001429C1F5|nr:DJ-1/PfpI family protein [Okeania sp. SIO2F4]NES03765.1 thiamine biosynthesis protein ThiJ [Okeania sp. SIO2F4]
MATATKGKIGVLIEDHFDSTEYLKFNEFFPQKGYEVEYITHLWGQKELHFGSNPENNVVEQQVTVSTEVNDINPSDYKGIICIGAYAMDRLRYQVNPKKGEPNQAPAVAFLRKAVNTENVKLGAICHSLWLFCADNEMIKNKKVTCAHNIICDVENAGADVIFNGDQTADLVIDGNLITAKHPGVTDEFMEKFVEAIEANN